MPHTPALQSPSFLPFLALILLPLVKPGIAWPCLSVPHASSQGCFVLSPLPAFPITPQSKRTVPSYTEISGKEPIACSISYPMQYETCLYFKIIHYLKLQFNWASCILSTLKGET